MSIFYKRSFDLRVPGLIILMVCAIGYINVYGQSATCSSPTNVAGFGVDGDVKANTPVGILGDSWFYSNIYPGSGIGVLGTTAATATPALSSAQFRTIVQTGNSTQRNRTYVQRMSVPNLSVVNGNVMIDAFSARDNFSPDSTAFLSSNKNGDNPSLWTIGSSSVPVKNDIIDVGGHLRRELTGAQDLWMYTYVTRLGTTGDAYTDIEIYRTVPYINLATGAFVNTGPAATGGHTRFTFTTSATIASPGDIILCVNYNTSGGVASVRIWCDITNLDGAGHDYLWFNSQAGRPFNFTGDFISGVNTNGYGYAEIQSLTGAGCLVYSYLNPANTTAGDWGNLTGTGAAFDTIIQPGQLVNIAFNFTEFGLDFASMSGPCFNVFGSVWFKTRTSSSFASSLTDCDGPYTFANFSEIQANAGPDKSLTCAVSQLSLQGSSPTPGAIISWSTPNGHIVSGSTSTTPVVDQPGTYIMYAENPTTASCTATDTVIVTLNLVKPEMQAGADKEITCASTSVSLSGFSTSPSNQFSWNAVGGGNILSGGNTATPSVNAAGCYILTVTDPSNGCTSIDTSCVTSDYSEPAITGITQVNVNCNTGCTGSISYSVSGGSAPYTYSWSNGSVSASLSNLCAGNYTVTVTGSNGCSGSNSFTISQPASPLSVSVIATQQVSCFSGANGEITATGNGGTAPYTYVWSNGQTGSTVSGLQAGTYTVTITDQNGCSTQDSETITQPSASVSATLNVSSNVLCFGGNSGSILSGVTGGVSPYTYLWNNGNVTSTLTGITSGNYTLTVTDANGCSSVSTVAVTQPSSALSSAATMSQSVACFGGNTGSANVTANGGTAPYTYDWSNGAISSAVGSLAAGTYTVVVTDNNGCTSQNTVTITQPLAALSSSVSSSQNINCFGGTNGSVNISVTGGTSPYTYLWNTGAQSQNLSALASGTYSVTITDSRGCTSVKSATLTQPSASLSGTAAASQNVSCFGGSNGSVNLSVAGGTSPYTYVWNTGAVSQNISNLTAGTYTVTVTDANGCTLVKNASITQPFASLGATLFVSQNVSCFGGSNGTVTSSVSGGTAPYTYNWNTSATSQNLSSLSSGSYTVTITDVNGCTVIRNTSISQPAAALAGTLALSQGVSCFGGNNGSLNLTVNGGTAPYSYAWSNGASSQDINNLSSGTYTVTVTDANNCLINFTSQVTQPSASLSAAASTSSNISCFGGSNGSVNLNTTGGTTPYTYNWSNGSISQNLTGIQAGTYTVTATDANGCTASATAQVSQPSGALNSVVTSTSGVSCFGGNNGSVNITVTNGTAPYNYSWSNGASSQDINNLINGTYTVTVTDANGCTNLISAVINQPAVALTPSITGTQSISCFGGNNGSVNLSVAGGTAPYSYIWNNGAVSQDLSSVAAGNYTVTVTDGNGCTAITNVSVTQPAASLSSSINSTQNVLCFGGASGTVNINVSGGTAPYLYSWSNGSASQNLSGVPAATYTVTVTDANGCTTTKSQVISQPAAALSSTANVTQYVSCFGGANGSINLTATGGTSPYTYAWSNGSVSEDISGLAAGTFTVTITDINGCTTARTVVVSQPSAALSALASQSQSVACNGGANGQATVTVNGGTAPYTYLWNNGSSLNSISNLSSGAYSVTVTDNNGCTKVSSVTITQPSAALSATTTATSNISCFSGNNGSINLTVNGGTSPYTFLWNTGAVTEDLSTLPAGNYTVAITDSRGCTTSATASITQPAGSLSANLNVSQNVACYGGGNGSLNLTVTGGTAPYNYTWSTGANTEDISGLAIGIYTVSITDNNGCISSATGQITQPSAALNAGINAAQNVSCFAGSNGSLDITVTGGTIPYSYSWSNGSVAQDLNNLSSGTYTVTITDANGCTFIKSGSISQPAAALNASASATANVSCYGGSNAQVNLTAAGGTIPYTYLWSNGSVTEDISGVSSGSYTVTITDANGCTGTATAAVTQPAAAVTLAVNSNIPVSCFGGNNGTASVIATGGTSPYSYLWSNGSATSSSTGLSNGTYTVTVTDNNGCSSSMPVTISQPSAALAGSVIPSQNVSCYGGTNGAANLTVNGGTSPYSYNWSNGSSSEDITSLAAGTYTVTVTDNKGCTLVQSITITQPSNALSASATVTANIACFSGFNGAVDLTPAGGTAPYGFQWNTGAVTEDITGLNAGMYTVTITDNNGCITTASAQVTQPPGSLAANVSVAQDVLCHNGNNGSLDLNVNGGTAPYTFSWSNGSVAEDLTGLSTGIYTVTVTDANGCITSQTAYVDEPAADLDAIANSIQSALCFGSSDGSIDITVSGGTAPYSYNWSNGENTEDIFSLTTGNYTVTVTDANGCTFLMSSFISQPSAALTSTPAVTQNVSCNGGNNGSADVTVSGGTSPYNYDWSNGSSTSSIGNLASGSYSVTITDAQGCTTTSSVTITQPAAALNVSLLLTQQVNCFAGEEGAIDLTVTGGTQPYTYSWNNGEITEDIANLGAGTYSVIVTDINGCIEAGQFVISQPNAPLIGLVAITSNVFCNGGSNGSIDLTVTGGTSPYVFAWSNGSVTEDINNLSTGMYSVTITDANGCTFSASAGIGQPNQQLSATTSVQNVLCFNGNNGLIDITPAGGTMPYTFLWNTGAVTEDLGALTAGSYSVTITDANGCDTVITSMVVQPVAPLIPALAVAQTVSCFGGNDGTVSITVTGGTMPYLYLWNTGATTSTVQGLSSGTYTVTVTDANGCNAIISDFISQPNAPLSAGISSVQPVACFGGSTGAINCSPSGGTAPYTYAWNTGAITQGISGLNAGTYTVTVTDTKGCTSTETTLVSQPSASVSVTGTTTIANCLNGIGGTVIISVTGGTPLYSYSWSNGITAQNLLDAAPGSYTVTITDANGCTANGTYTVGNNSEFNLQTDGPVIICAGDNATLVADSISGGSYQWYYQGAPLMGANTNVFITPASGFYSVSISIPCGMFYTDSIEVIVKSVENASISSDQIICPPEYVQLFATGGTSYEWTPSTNISFSTVPDPIVNPVTTTTYTVLVTNEWNCKTTMNVQVTVACDTLLVPNGFSPNGDGTNDGYVIDGIENYPGNKLWVYNRWGNLVYKAKDYKNNWDGVCNVSGVIMGKRVPEGTYYFILDLNDNSKPRAGYLIIRGK
jgi:gliding motility-associated-like protein